MQEKSYIKIKNLTKVFSGVAANDNISIDINEKEVLTIIGENGAGKSTFCKMLTGVYQPDGGSIEIDGKEVRFHNAMESTEAGIGMVYQERNLIGYLTGAQNICFGLESKKGVLISEKESMQRALAVRDKLGLSVPLDVRVDSLGVGEQQLIEIMRAFSSNPKLLILDEPTSSLGEKEIKPFLNFIKDLKNRTNISVIFISHKIEEVFEIADKIAVFTDGKCTLQKKASETTQDECITAMLRTDKVKPIEVPETDFSASRVVLDVDIDDAKYDNREHSIHFQSHASEIVGVYGLVGAGRTEFAEVMFGLRRAEHFSYAFDGKKLSANIPAAKMLSEGMILIPEKRINGIFSSMSITKNVCNLFLKRKLSNWLRLVDFKKARAFSREVCKKNLVKYQNTEQAIMELSGGNIQKIIIGRSIELENIKLLILDEPTTGMDIGAKNEVYQHLRKLVADTDISIIFISSELDELMSVCDKLYVFSGGSTAGEFLRKDFDKAAIIECAIKE